MKVIDNITVYKCDHCSKKLFRKHAMQIHEKKCTKNPKNIRACFNCTFCKRIKIKYEPESGGLLQESTSFKCTTKNIFMFPPKLEHPVERLPSYVEYRDKEILQDKMPLTCDMHKLVGMNEYSL